MLPSWRRSAGMLLAVVLTPAVIVRAPDEAGHVSAASAVGFARGGLLGQKALRLMVIASGFLSSLRRCLCCLFRGSERGKRGGTDRRRRSGSFCRRADRVGLRWERICRGSNFTRGTRAGWDGGSHGSSIDRPTTGPSSYRSQPNKSQGSKPHANRFRTAFAIWT
jgi:hypothetical protein